MPIQEADILKPSKKCTFLKRNDEEGTTEHLDLFLPPTKWQEFDLIRDLEGFDLVRDLEGEEEAGQKDQEPTVVPLGANVSFQGLKDAALFVMNDYADVPNDHVQRRVDLFNALNFLRIEASRLPIPVWHHKALAASWDGPDFTVSKTQSNNLANVLKHLWKLTDTRAGGSGPPLTVITDGANGLTLNANPDSVDDFLHPVAGQTPVEELRRHPADETRFRIELKQQVEAPLLEAPCRELGPDLKIISSRCEESLRWGWHENRVFAGVRLLQRPAKAFYVEVLLVGDWSDKDRLAIGGFPEDVSMDTKWRMLQDEENAARQSEVGCPLQGTFVSLHSRRLHIGVEKVHRQSRDELARLPTRRAYPEEGSRWAVRVEHGTVKVGVNNAKYGQLVWHTISTPVPEEELCAGLLLQPRYIPYDGSAQVQILRVETR